MSKIVVYSFTEHPQIQIGGYTKEIDALKESNR